jgi:hypothetical protein
MNYLIAIALIATNFTGTWTGTMMTGGTAKDPAFMVLAQVGNLISGTIGPDRQDQFKITKASIDDDTLTVEAQPGQTLRFVMKMDGDNLVGQVFEDGEPIGTIRFERIKE